jgi:hypothetical protein
MNHPPHVQDLTQERGLWSVFVSTLRVRRGKLSIWILVITGALLSINAFAFSIPTSVVIQDLRRWSEIGLNFSVTTLGFLVAGYTIFATLSNPAMMAALLNFKDSETGFSKLKANHLKLVKPIIEFIILASFYMFILITAQPYGLLSNLAKEFNSIDSCVYIVSRIIYIIAGAGLVYLIGILQSFVFSNRSGVGTPQRELCPC